MWSWNNRTCAIKYFIRHWLYTKLYYLQYNSLGDRCTAPFKFFTVQSRSGTPLLSAHWESPSLFIWPIPRRWFMSFLAPNWHLEISRRHRELRLASTVYYERRGRCTFPRSVSHTKRNEFRIRQVRDTETILSHTLSSFSYHFTKGSLNPNVVKLVEVGSTYPFFYVCIHYLSAVSSRVEIIFGRFSKFFETFKPLQNFRVR